MWTLIIPYGHQRHSSQGEEGKIWSLSLRSPFLGVATTNSLLTYQSQRVSELVRAESYLHVLYLTAAIFPRPLL